MNKKDENNICRNSDCISVNIRRSNDIIIDNNTSQVDTSCKHIKAINIMDNVNSNGKINNTKYRNKNIGFVLLSLNNINKKFINNE